MRVFGSNWKAEQASRLKVLSCIKLTKQIKDMKDQTIKDQDRRPRPKTTRPEDQKTRREMGSEDEERIMIVVEEY